MVDQQDVTLGNIATIVTTLTVNASGLATSIEMQPMDEILKIVTKVHEDIVDNPNQFSPEQFLSFSRQVSFNRRVIACLINFRDDWKTISDEIQKMASEIERNGE